MIAYATSGFPSNKFRKGVDTPERGVRIMGMETAIRTKCRGARIGVEIGDELREHLWAEATARSSVVRRVTASDIIREMLASRYGVENPDVSPDYIG